MATVAGGASEAVRLASARYCPGLGCPRGDRQSVGGTCSTMPSRRLPPSFCFGGRSAFGKKDAKLVRRDVTMPRTRARDAIRRASAQFRRIRPTWEACSFGSDPRDFPAGLRETCLRSCGGTMLRRRERAATFRCDPGFKIVSSNRTTSPVDQIARRQESPFLAVGTVWERWIDVAIVACPGDQQSVGCVS